MNEPNLHLLDLPNEILLYIMTKLNNTHVLYSLLDIKNQRLHALAKSEIFSNILSFEPISSSGDVSSDILDRFCNEILPQVHHNVKHLILDSLSMERILRAAHYPNLTQLKLHNVNKQTVASYFKNDSIFQRIREQITDLYIITNETRMLITLYGYTMYVYALILPVFKNLKHLTIAPLANSHHMPISLKNLPSTTFFSSTLTKLDIHVEGFDDCLALLDGRLKQLTTFIVQIGSIKFEPSVSYNIDNLPNLKCFSLICYTATSSYDNQVVPLLRRMSHLEELTLYVYIDGRPTFVDGIHLHDQVLIHMPRLYKFIFYINTTNITHFPTRRLSNDDMQQTFLKINYSPVVSILDYETFHRPRCQVFSVPFQFRCLKWLTNNFPPIIFHSVTRLGLWDRESFQHEFFLRIAQSFPSLKYLTVKNISDTFRWWCHNDSKVTERPSSIVKYPHLISLTIKDASIGYVDQFLNEAKTHLSSLIELTVRFNALKEVTHNFTRDATRRNCVKVERLFFENLMNFSEEIRRYFPSLSKINYYDHKIRLYDTESHFLSI